MLNSKIETNILEICNLYSIFERVKVYSAILVYKLLNTKCDSKHIMIFDIANSKLKSKRNNLLRLPFRVCEAFKRSIKFRIFNNWNNLIPALRQPELTLKEFVCSLNINTLQERK